MKNILRFIVVVIVLAISSFLFFANVETTLKKEDFASKIDRNAEINRLEVIRGSDNEKVTLKGSEAKDLYNELTHAKLRATGEGVNKRDYGESYWIIIGADNERVLGIRFLDSGILDWFEFIEGNNIGGSYFVQDDSKFKTVEALF